MTDSKRIAHIDELIRLGKGDLGRLEHIKESIENGKTLYNSDRVYIESLEKSHLVKNQSKASDISKNIQDQSEASDILSESIKIKDYLSDAKPKNKDNDTSTKINDRNTRPVSRFWAFLFAPTIFGLIWVVDFQTTRKWILISLLHVPWMTFLIFSYIFDMDLLNESIFSENLFIGSGLISIVGLYANLLISSYFMYKWATLYNIKQFGYATRAEWLIGRHDPKPVSIFWACYFAHSNFALFWAISFKTTRKWIVISTITGIASLLLSRILEISSDDSDLLVLILSGISIVIFFIPIYFMYKWAIRYNIKQFGCTTKQEWLIDHHEAKPLSIFWACFFANSIFALIWAMDFKTARKWIVISIITAIACCVLLIPYMIPITSFDSSDPLSQVSYFDDFAPFVLESIGAIIVTSIVLRIYFMYKWATRYNIKQFGCTTKQEWLIDHHEAKPVSRFWACFFANSIFALIWAMDFKTARKWTVISIISIIVCCISLVPFMIFVTSLDNFNLSLLMSYFDDPDPLMLVSIVSGIVVSVVPRSYFMYKWATRYNLKNFSYASRKEWLNAMRESS